MSEIQSNMPNQPFLIANVNIRIIFTTYTVFLKLKAIFRLYRNSFPDSYVKKQIKFYGIDYELFIKSIGLGKIQ